MNCPGCEHEMDVQRFPANYGGEVEIDVCAHCNGIWFDGRESLQLSPGATLNLFKVLYARNDQAKAQLSAHKKCPRCGDALKETNDLQRGTKFSYFRCATHGRFITFFQFLREKNLVRQMSPKELQQLKEQVQTVKCSNCGGPIELALGTTCPHCQAPVSILSEENIKQTLKDLQAKEEKRTTVAPDAAARIVQAQLQAQAAYKSYDANNLPLGISVGRRNDGGDLIAAGAELLIDAIFAIW
jgi:Zn-finger nucleic acid-binding protein